MLSRELIAVTGQQTYAWDVDNDNDGIPDSIWIDPGLPVVTTNDGRRYKRLAAILIKDLDGSINVNAHGNLAQVDPTNRDRYRAEMALSTTTPTTTPFVPPYTTSNGQNIPAYVPPPGRWPLGAGLGPDGHSSPRNWIWPGGGLVPEHPEQRLGSVRGDNAESLFVWIRNSG